ncbi:MAG: hypothetical protein M3R21_04390 [Candidatus Dormibacteraeota bacterium]|nr:hypothetical protein [Candidatus Dormibacteraeota bacterium]
MEVPLLLQFSIALCTGMVAATLVPPIRKSIPRPIEILMWFGLVVACVVGVLSIANPHARELTNSTFWGVDQVITTLVGLMGIGLLGWLGDIRFTIAPYLVFLCGADILALALVHSHRKSKGWQPRVRLREWMEMPRRVAPVPEPVVAPAALDHLNRRWAATTAVARTACLTWFVNHSVWAKQVLATRQAERLAQAAALGRVESRARLESLRDTASQPQFSARGWYTAAGAAAVSGIATRATEAVRTAKSGQGAAAAERSSSRMVDDRVQLSAQSIGWYGPKPPAPAVRAGEEDEDASAQSDRLAS